ncbi:MAG: ComF family protein [Clostridia bacterium]|nr:ComF family protein [Clostridia bacterium]
MKIREILKRAFMPRQCILCKEVIDYDQEMPFCESCMVEWLANLDLMCGTCGFDAENCICLPEGVREINHSIASFGVFYTPKAMTPVNRIVYRLKRDYKLEVIRFCANIIYQRALKLCEKYKIDYSDFCVTFPPRKYDSVKKYGYDHAELLAKEFAKLMGLELIKVFENVGEKEQKSLTKKQRLANAASSFDLLDGLQLKGKSLFLIDDVMTTGATLHVCARMLRHKGAKTIIPITFAKDM